MAKPSEQWSHAIRQPLVAAFVISLVFHAALYGTYKLFPETFQSTKSYLTDLLANALRPDPSESPRLAALPKSVQEQLMQNLFQQREIPLTFIEVDPAQAVAEPPKEAKYYSSHSTVAANPLPEKDTTQPQADGQQDKVPRLFTNPKPQPKRNPQPLQPAPEPKETDPAPRTVPAPKEEQQPPQVRPDAKPETKSEPPKPLEQIASTTLEKTEEKPDMKLPGGLTIGDLALAKPQKRERTNKVEGAGAPISANPLIAEPSPPAHVRPRTLAQAYQQNPALAGKAMRQEGGVKRPGRIVSVDAAASPFGVYDRAFIAAVEERWYQLIDAYRERGGVLREGKVVLDFDLRYDGRITDLAVAERSVDEILSMLCQRAVLDPAPFQRWPGDMRRMIGADFREVRFTFYYD